MDNQITNKETETITEILLLMFPEIIPIVIFVVCSPIWSIYLVIDGFIFQAVVLLLTTGFGTFWFIKFLRAKKQMAVYFIGFGILIIVLIVHWSLPISGRFLK